MIRLDYKQRRHGSDAVEPMALGIGVSAIRPNQGSRSMSTRARSVPGRHCAGARRPDSGHRMTGRGLMIAVALLCAPPAVSRAHAETLRDAVRMAWSTNPELAAARARQEALAETPEQARAAGRLTAEANAGLGYDRLGYGRAGVGSVAATLPIWTGGRVAAAARAAEGDVAAGAALLRDAEAAILERVVGAYADLLFNQQAAQVARVGIERLDRQVDEARSRYGLGQATRTDVAQLEAQRASVAADFADAEGTLAAARAAYRAAVGRDAGILQTEAVRSAGLPETLAAARGAAEAANPLLAAQRRAVEASAARIDQARADGAPALGLSADYGRGVRRTGGDWRDFPDAASAGLAFRLPLLTGGFVPSRVRQARAALRAERYQASAAERETRRGVDTAWAQVAASDSRLAAATDGLAAADLALRGVRAEYGFGLRSTIDILVADQSFRSAQLAVARASADLLIAQAALLRAVGRMGPGSFG